MGDKRKFGIGEVVRVNLNNRVEADYDRGNYRRIQRRKDWKGHDTDTNELVLARITGVKTFQEGQYEHGSKGGYGLEYVEEPAYLSVKGTVTTWAVRLGYKNKEIHFFEEDINPVDGALTHDKKGNVVVAANEDIPYFYNSWNDHYREQMSRESKEWPRDAEGKWSK